MNVLQTLSESKMCFLVAFGRDWRLFTCDDRCTQVGES